MSAKRKALASGKWGGATWTLDERGHVRVTGAFTVPDPGELPLVVLLQATSVDISADTTALESVDALVREIPVPTRRLRGAAR